MPDDTDILSLPLILPSQAQKHVTHNEALLMLDVIVQLAVIDRDQTVPPVLAAIGDRHIVPSGATLDWAGQAGKIAVLTETGWQFHSPNPGWQAHVLAEGTTAVFDGLVWKAPAEGGAEFAQLGVSATADATNRLSVSSPATLLNHAGAGHQLKLNKAAATDTASLLFQTGFSGRAEMGTSGSDAFSVKVSADGSAWNSALTAAPATGEVSFPAPVHLGGQATDPASPPNGTFWLNTTSGEVKVRTGGSTVVVGAGGGGGVSDGDKGDITVSGGGTTWTIDAGAVTLAKLASLASSTILGRVTGGSGVPEALTAAQARGILNVADGANAYAHPNHSGDVTSVADGATTIAAGAVSLAKMASVGTATVFYRKTAGSGAPEVQSLATLKTDLGLTGTNSGDQTIALTGDVTGSGTGSFAATIGAGAVTNAKLADMATATVKGRTSAGSGAPEDLSGADVTALLDTFTSGAKGLAPASGGGTANFLRADGTWAAPGGGVSLALWDWWEDYRLGQNTATAGDVFLGAAISSGTNNSALGSALGYNPHGVFLRSSTTANGGYRYQTSSLISDWFGTVSHKFRCQFLWRTDFTGRIVRLGFLDTTTSADSTDGAYFEINGAVCSAKTALGGTRTTNATTPSLSLTTPYTFEIDVNAAGTEARFRVFSALNETPILDVINTNNIPISSANSFGAGIVATEASTTASEIGILYSLGVGTVAGYQRATGRS